MGLFFPTVINPQSSISDISSSHQWKLDNLQKERYQGVQGWNAGKERKKKDVQPRH